MSRSCKCKGEGKHRGRKKLTVPKTRAPSIALASEINQGPLSPALFLCSYRPGPRLETPQEFPPKCCRILWCHGFHVCPWFALLLPSDYPYFPRAIAKWFYVYMFLSMYIYVYMTICIYVYIYLILGFIHHFSISCTSLVLLKHVENRN